MVGPKKYEINKNKKYIPLNKVSTFKMQRVKNKLLYIVLFLKTWFVCLLNKTEDDNRQSKIINC